MTNSAKKTNNGHGGSEGIVSFIKHEIRDGKLRSGDPMPSERKMADQFQVARDTVRRAYQELARQGCILMNGRSRRTVAAMQPSPHSLLQNTFAVLGSSVFNPEWLERIDAEDHYVLANAAHHIEQQGFHVIFVNAQTLLQHGVDSILSARPRGVLLATPLLRMNEIRNLVQTLKDTDSGVVIYGDEEIDVAGDRLYSDHVSGARQLTAWLLQQKCRRILPVVPGARMQGFMERRIQGYAKAMKTARRKAMDPLLISALDHDARVDWPFDEQVRIATGYLAPYLTCDKPVDALMAVNDPDAYLLAAACRALGLTPNKEVLIVGYDNSGSRAGEREWESQGPAATVDKCNSCLAAEVAKLALARARRELPDDPQEVVLKPKLIVLNK